MDLQGGGGGGGLLGPLADKVCGKPSGRPKGTTASEGYGVYEERSCPHIPSG